MQINLSSELEQFVSNQVKSGSFESPSAVVCEGLNLLREREQQLADLRAKLQEGADQLDSGEGVPAADVFDEIRERHRMRLNSADRKRA